MEYTASSEKKRSGELHSGSSIFGPGVKDITSCAFIGQIERYSPNVAARELGNVDE